MKVRKVNSRVLGLVLAAAGTFLLTRYAYGCKKESQKLATKKTVKEAVQSWEGEGGALVEPAPRIATG